MKIKSSKKAAALPEPQEVQCRGYEVMVWWQSGGIDAWSNCRLDEFGQCESYYAKLFEKTVSAERIKAGEQWRCDNWKERFDAIGQYLCRA